MGKRDAPTDVPPSAGGGRRLLKSLIFLAFAGLILRFGAHQAEAGPGAAAAQAVSKVSAPTPAPNANPNAVVDIAAANQALSNIQNQLPTTTNDAQLASLAQQAATLDGAIDRALGAQQGQLAQVEAALKKIHIRRHESEAERTKRASLLAQQDALLMRSTKTQLLAYRADDVISSIAERRRESFSARVLERSASPLTPTFWTSLADAIAADLSRLNFIASHVLAVALAASEPKGLLGLALGVALALGMALAVVGLLHRRGLKRPGAVAAPGGHTFAIVWRVCLEMAVPVLAAAAVRLGAQWGGLLAPAGEQIAQAAIGAIAWAAAILALGRGLALARQPNHRLLNIGESEARRARAALWVVAVITAGGFFVERLNFIMGASLAATIAANCAISLAYVGAAFLILASFGRNDASTETSAEAATEVARGPAWTLMSLTLGGAIVATVGAVLLGYTTLAALISNQIFWLSLLGAGAFLTLRLVDDLFSNLFRERGSFALALHQLFGLRVSTVLQVGLLLSAAFQVLIILAVILLALTPFGASGRLLVSHVRELGSDVHLGKVTISPAGVAGGVVTLIVGIALSHLVRGWVVRRYLPVTRWDTGVRNSVSTGVSYVGIALAVACALAVTGVGLQQIALVAGALSVGIGFGLQQIVQNFVAGIILLVERPVKVGDWVNVGGVEGDVLSIRVRATDIRDLDGSTVIVPNSSLITTNVQNKTLGDPHARVQLQVTVTKPGDVMNAIDLITQLISDRPDVLKTPAPQVFVDALVAGGGANLSASLYVANPRAANRIKSEVYIAVLGALQKSEIGI